jgi:hypothetical protein
MLAEVMFDEMEPAVFDSGDLLYRFPVVENEACAQGFVAAQNPVQRAAESSTIQIAF